MSALRPRGQATTELALGSLVFVVVLLFGIHFGEVPVLMLKVKEAANYAMTHATGARVHQFTQSKVVSGNTFTPFNPVAVGTNTLARYRDFDGMSDRTGGATFTQTMTQADGFTSTCTATDAVRFGLRRPNNTVRAAGNAQGFYDAAFNFLDTRLEDRGGVSCDVAARVTAIRIPSSFADNGAGKLSEQKLGGRGSFPICGAGKPSGGSCSGSLIVLTGDWSIDGPLTGNTSNLNGDVENVQDGLVVNDGYETLVRQLYLRNGDSQSNAGRHLLQVGAGLNPGRPEFLDESRFNMSFRGVVGGTAVPKVPRVNLDGQQLRYQTSGADLRSGYVGWTEAGQLNVKETQCFLGQRGCL